MMYRQIILNLPRAASSVLAACGEGVPAVTRIESFTPSFASITFVLLSSASVEVILRTPKGRLGSTRSAVFCTRARPETRHCTLGRWGAPVFAGAYVAAISGGAGPDRRLLRRCAALHAIPCI